MKKILCLLLFLVMFCSYNVKALQHITSEIIPVDEVASVNTDTLRFDGITYVSQVEGKTYGQLKIETVENKTEKILPVGVNLLLFDSNKLNIGYLTYCSELDVGSDYAQFKLKSNSTTEYSINVTTKYFVEGKKPTDVAYYAFQNENPYCQDGGYTKYAGLTMEQITSGMLASDIGDDPDEPVSFLERYSLGMIIRTIVITLILYVVAGIFLNILYKKMFFSTTPLSYLPISNFYIAVKLAFGNKVGIIYLIILFVSIPMFLLKIFSFFLYLMTFVAIVAFVIDIIKLVTNRYDLCYLEPYSNNSLVDGINSGSGIVLETKKIFGLEDDADEDGLNNNVEQENRVVTRFINEDVELPVKEEDNQNDNSNESSAFNVLNAIRSGEDINVDSSIDNEEANLKSEENNGEGESDLMNMFK